MMSATKGLYTIVTCADQSFVSVKLGLSNLSQLGHREPRVPKGDVFLWLIPTVVERPGRHLELCEPNLHPDAVFGDVGGHLAGGRDQLVGWFLPVTYIDPENHVSLFQ